MIPGNPDIRLVTEDTRFLVSRWPVPDSRSTQNELRDYEQGGIALQDPSKGLQYQNWTGYWDPTDSTAYLQPETAPESPPIPIFTESDVVEFTFTFDQNMRWAAATRKADKTMQFRWYDSAVEAYVTSHYSDVTSVRLCHDDKRSVQVFLGTSDILITYLSAGKVHWRIQRDRYLTQYTKHDLTVSASHRISHFGLSQGLRLQWRIGVRHT